MKREKISGWRILFFWEEFLNGGIGIQWSFPYANTINIALGPVSIQIYFPRHLPKEK